MKAIIENNQTWIITEERGSFFYTERLGKTKCFNKNEVQVVEAEPEKPKYRKSKPVVSKGPQNKVKFLMSLIAANLEENMNARNIYGVIAANVNDIPEIVESILNQANYKLGRISEKQIYVIAKFMNDNFITL